MRLLIILLLTIMMASIATAQHRAPKYIYGTKSEGATVKIDRQGRMLYNAKKYDEFHAVITQQLDSMLRIETRLFDEIGVGTDTVFLTSGISEGSWDIEIQGCDSLLFPAGRTFAWIVNDDLPIDTINSVFLARRVDDCTLRITSGDGGVEPLEGLIGAGKLLIVRRYRQ